MSKIKTPEELITDNHIKAFNIIQEKRVVNGFEFAQLMWPESNMHNDPLCIVARNGHSCLYKLLRRGFVAEHKYKYPQFYLTPKAIEILNKWNNY